MRKISFPWGSKDTYPTTKSLSYTGEIKSNIECIFSMMVLIFMQRHFGLYGVSNKVVFYLFCEGGTPPPVGS